MLNLTTFSDLKNKKKYRDFKAVDQLTYLVPDLVSKTEIQNKILNLKNKVVLEENSVLRVNELWSKIGLTLCPELNCVSGALVKSLLAEWLKDEEDLDWLKSSGSVSQLFQYMQQLLPLFSQGMDIELMIEWFKNNPQSYLRWGGWFQVSQKYWLKLQEENIIPSSWLPAFLVYHPEIHSFKWDRKLIFDLNFDLSLIEAELIQILSQKNEIEVYSPENSWSKEYQSCLIGYSLLKGESLYSDMNELGEIPIEIYFNKVEEVEFEKHTTMISEVKSVTAQIRRWIDEGAKPQEIAVLAPDIEIYWKALSSYFSIEGIPVFKNRVSLAHLKPAVASWLAHIRLRVGKISYADLELSEYARFTPSTLDYEDFTRLFSQIYDEKDLDRNSKLKKMYEADYSINDKLTRDEFVIWSLKNWETQNIVEYIEKIYHQLLLEAPPHFKLDALSWTSYLETLASKLEESITKEEFGVYCTNIDSSENLNIRYACVVGLTESALTEIEQTSMSLSDIMSLSEEVGYSLDREDKAQVEFALRWTMSQDMKKVCFMAPETDFTGKIEAPATFWIRGALASGKSLDQQTSPQVTRWDEIQKTDTQELVSNLQISSDQGQLLLDQVQLDLGKIEQEPVDHKIKFSLSATQLEKYAQCPFKFFSEKILHLSDLPEIDLDVDRMTRGQLMHLIFEKIVEHEVQSSISDKELGDFLDEVFRKSDLTLADKGLWGALREKYILLARKFMDFELSWKNEYQQTNHLATELEIKAYWDNEHGCLTKKKTDYMFRGYIDRVDGDNDKYAVIIDYKSSLAQAKNINVWNDEDSFQMSLYAQAIEQGLTDLKDRKVIGAVYYVPKNLDRKKGFQDKDHDHLYPNTGRSKSLVNREEIEDVFIQVNQKIKIIVDQMVSGNFKPQPKNDDFKICKICSWSKLCRAPHLN